LAPGVVCCCVGSSFLKIFGVSKRTNLTHVFYLSRKARVKENLDEGYLQARWKGFEINMFMLQDGVD